MAAAQGGRLRQARSCVVEQKEQVRGRQGSLLLRALSLHPSLSLILSMFGGWFGGGKEEGAPATPPQQGEDANATVPPPAGNAAQDGGMFSGAFSFMKGILGMDQLKVEETKEENKTDIDEGKRKGLFSQLSNMIGKDITSMISLPVWVFEPLSFLQIMSEPLQYDYLLQKVFPPLHFGGLCTRAAQIKGV